MNRTIFKYLIPAYGIWFFIHTIFFTSFIISQSISDTIPKFAAFGLMMLSHFLVIMTGLAFWIFMIVDCTSRKFKDSNERIIWILVIVLGNVLGSIVYYYIHGKNKLKK